MRHLPMTSTRSLPPCEGPSLCPLVCRFILDLLWYVFWCQQPHGQNDAIQVSDPNLVSLRVENRMQEKTDCSLFPLSFCPGPSQIFRSRNCGIVGKLHCFEVNQRCQIEATDPPGMPLSLSLCVFPSVIELLSWCGLPGSKKVREWGCLGWGWQ